MGALWVGKNRPCFRGIRVAELDIHIARRHCLLSIFFNIVVCKSFKKNSIIIKVCSRFCPALRIICTLFSRFSYFVFYESFCFIFLSYFWLPIIFVSNVRQISDWLHFPCGPKSSFTMVLVLEGNSEIGAHVRRNSC